MEVLDYNNDTVLTQIETSNNYWPYQTWTLSNEFDINKDENITLIELIYTLQTNPENVTIL